MASPRALCLRLAYQEVNLAGGGANPAAPSLHATTVRAQESAYAGDRGAAAAAAATWWARWGHHGTGRRALATVIPGIQDGSAPPEKTIQRRHRLWMGCGGRRPTLAPYPRSALGSMGWLKSQLHELASVVGSELESMGVIRRHKPKMYPSVS